MAHGLLLDNKSGVTLIDGDSKQVHIVKSGVVTPGSPSAYYNPNNAPSPPAVVVPQNKESSLMFIRAKQLGSSVSGVCPAVSIMWADGRYSITPAGYVAPGTQTFYCSISWTSLGYEAVGSYNTMSGYQTPIQDPAADLLGASIEGWNQYFPSTTAPKIISISQYSSSMWSVTFDRATVNTMYSDRTADIPMNVATFCTSAYWGWNSNFAVEYKFGAVTTQTEESGQYGLEIYKPDGSQIIAWSSNRQNHQIENIVSGQPDLQPGTTTGSPAAQTPIITTEVQDVLNWENYFALVSASGYIGAFCDSNRDVRTWSVGYAFSVPGQVAYDNAGHLSNPTYGGPGSAYKTHSTAMGIAMIPMDLTRNLGAGPLVYGSPVTDSWTANATRSLITGKLV